MLLPAEDEDLLDLLDEGCGSAGGPEDEVWGSVGGWGSADEAGICWWCSGPPKGLRIKAGCVCTHRTAQKAVQLGFCAWYLDRQDI
jgi:hypothetical protein